MKDVYESIDDFIKDVMPLEYRRIMHSKTKPEKHGSDSAAYKFEEKLLEIMSDKEDSKS